MVGHLKRTARVAFLTGTLAIVGPALAVAHTRLERSSPSAGAHLDRAPRELRLVFSAAVEPALARLQLVGPDSAEVPLGVLRVDSARTMSAAISGPLVSGTYTVAWQVAGGDGHPIRGRFQFTVAPGAEGLAIAGGAVPRQEPAPAPAAHHQATTFPGQAGFDAESPLYVAVRWVTFTTLLVIIGTVAFRMVVLPLLRRRDREGRRREFATATERPAAMLGLGAASILTLAAIARLGAQSYAMHGGGDAMDGSLVVTMLTRTVWGWGWIAQLVGVAVALTGFALARRPSRVGWMLAAAGTILLAFTLSLSGHAASAPRLTALVMLADGLHVMGAGGWLGSLLVVTAIGIPAALRLEGEERGAAVADLVNAFSPTALLFAGMTVLTGFLAAWVHLGALPALWQSTYGKTLLVKLAILSVVLATGAYNWLRVRPALGDLAGADRMRRSATVEVAVGVLVLIVTAILVATPTPMDAHGMTAP